MAVVTVTRSLKTSGEGDTHDITPDVAEAVRESGLQDGTATVFVNGSTGALTTIEFEPGVVNDLRDAYERTAPRDLEYAHEQAWHDGNGHSHLQATMLGPSLSVPVGEGRMILGTWQQIFHLECDVRPRSRTVVVTVYGD